MLYLILHKRNQFQARLKRNFWKSANLARLIYMFGKYDDLYNIIIESIMLKKTFGISRNRFEIFQKGRSATIRRKNR